ncbi:MAG: 30S ribosome-binding factor RbfA [Thermoguttaceae bacterium]
MASRRTLKAGQAIREVIAMSLLIDLKDPRVSQVTVNSVEVASDMRTAKVLFTVLGGDPVKEKLALAGFRSAAGFLQQKCAKRIETRYTPKLTFAIDEGVKNLIRISEILEKERQQSASAKDAVDKVAESSDPKGTDIQQGD